MTPEQEKRAVRVMVRAYQELNAIRARTGVPCDLDGYRTSVDPDYFSSVIDGLDEMVRELTGKSAHCHPALYEKDAEGV